VLREAEMHQGTLQEQLADVQGLLKGKRHAKEITGLVAEHREEMLRMGAAIRLLIAGRLGAVFPPDDAALLDAANPLLDNASAMAAREMAMAKKALAAAGPLAVIICGGSHDLAAALQGQDCEYLRVWVRGYAEAAK
jgi:hypothetical protein